MREFDWIRFGRRIRLLSPGEVCGLTTEHGAVGFGPMVLFGLLDNLGFISAALQGLPWTPGPRALLSDRFCPGFRRYLTMFFLRVDYFAPQSVVDCLVTREAASYLCRLLYGALAGVVAEF